MEISIKKVKKIADAAKISIMNEEIQVYAQQLNAIQNMIDEIEQLEIEDVPPMLYVSTDVMVLREDDCFEIGDDYTVKEQAIFNEDNYIVVPKVM